MYDQKKEGLERLLEYFIKFFRVIGIILINPSRIAFLLNLNFRGFFYETGFFKSREIGLPVDVNGEPIPWVTYSFIWFIEERLNKSHEIFEFGSGNSTKFYAKRCKNIMSVEHNMDWVNIIQPELPSNCELIFKESSINGEYSKTAATSKKMFDMIIVDGRDRVNCVKNSVSALKPHGVLVLDDAFRPNYEEAVSFMLNNGYKKIDFWGPAPLSFRKKNTTIFYKKYNILNI